MKQSTKLAVGVAAIAFAIAAGTGAYAMRGSSPADKQERVAAGADRLANPQGGAASTMMCAMDVPECGDLVVNDGGGGNLIGGDADPGAAPDCPPDMACIEPWLMDPPVCPDGVDMSECFPDGPPAGYDCRQLETFPPQVACVPIVRCGVPLGPITILPAPDDTQTNPPAVAPDAPQPDPPHPTPVDPEPIPCDPPIACDFPLPVEPDGVEKPLIYPCLTPDCAVSSDGTTSCPPPEPCVITTDPMAGIASNECPLPLPPNCTVHEDGSVSCEGSGPACDPAADFCEGSGGGTSGSPGVSEPGSAGPQTGTACNAAAPECAASAGSDGAVDPRR